MFSFYTVYVGNCSGERGRGFNLISHMKTNTRYLLSCSGKYWLQCLWRTADLCCSVTAWNVLFPRWTCDSWWATTQEQQGLKGNELWGCHDDESVMTKTVSGLLPQPVAPFPSHMHTQKGVGLDLGSTGPHLFWIASITPTHPPTVLTAYFYSQRHMQTIVQGDRSDVGQEISVYVYEAPLPVYSLRATIPLIQRLCVSGFHLPSDSQTLAVFLCESSLSHTCFSFLSSFRFSLWHSLLLLCFYWLWKTMEFCWWISPSWALSHLLCFSPDDQIMCWHWLFQLAACSYSFAGQWWTTRVNAKRRCSSSWKGCCEMLTSFHYVCACLLAYIQTRLWPVLPVCLRWHESAWLKNRSLFLCGLQNDALSLFLSLSAQVSITLKSKTAAWLCVNSTFASQFCHFLNCFHPKELQVNTLCLHSFFLMGSGILEDLLTVQDRTFGASSRVGPDLRAVFGLTWGSGIRDGRMQWGGHSSGLLLHCAPQSNIAVVKNSQRGLAGNQKLHNCALKPVGCHAFPPLSVFIISAFDVLNILPELLVLNIHFLPCWIKHPCDQEQC